VKILGSDAV